MSDAYQYALWRVVPDLQRGEALNAGIVLFCRRRRFLDARVELDAERLRALDPRTDQARLTAHLHGLQQVARGEAAGGPIAQLDPTERFGWLVAPASTVVQPGPVHTGICPQDPAALLDRLFAQLVLPPS